MYLLFMIDANNFEWGGVDCGELAENFGTPLYVFDENIINSRCEEIQNKFLRKYKNTFAYYAGKAFLTRYMANLIKNNNLGLDVVSGGELYTALSADFDPQNIEMHGNSKSYDEILMAIKNNVGRIIVDCPDELKIISEISRQNNYTCKILIRVCPGVDAHTHKSIATGNSDSKFGVPIDGKMLIDMIKFAMNDANINLMGLHFHVGSQLFSPDDHIKALNNIIKLIKKLKSDLNFTTRELNLGGGLGAVKNPKYKSVELEKFIDPLMKILYNELYPVPKITIEPGRWIISESGITIYTVENIKIFPEIIYIAVNGGMADNPRYALYNAEYDCVNIKNPNGKLLNLSYPNKKISIVGKCCESGDILIDNAEISNTNPGDLIVLYNTGAYTFSMSSNYNKLLRPAVVFVKDGEAKLKVERQKFEDLISGDYI